MILIFATVPPRLAFSLRRRASALSLCRLLVNRVGAFLIYVCASEENAIGRSRGFHKAVRHEATRAFSRLPDTTKSDVGEEKNCFLSFDNLERKKSSSYRMFNVSIMLDRNQTDLKLLKVI